MQRFILLIFAATILAAACRQEVAEREVQEVVIRLKDEPDRLNPILSASGYATMVERMIFQSLFDFDPYTLEFKPVMVTGPAEVSKLEDGRTTYSFRLRDDATWSDGEPILAHDYVFSVKLIFHPLVQAASVRGYTSFIDGVGVDPEDPRRFTVTTGDYYMLAETILGSLSMYPEHIYDPEGILGTVPLDTLLDAGAAGRTVEADDRLKQFALDFNGNTYSREIVSGSGPYELVKWETGQRIELQRKQDWWGSNYESEGPLFAAHPERLVYLVIPDEAVAITNLKDGSLDVMYEIDPDNFVNLSRDSALRDKFHFFTPALMHFYALSMNNHDPKLEDKRVRRALTHLFDMDYMVDNIMEGFASPTIGPIHPDKPYYNDEIRPVEFDPGEAARLLDEAGWTDTNGNGIRDKQIDGQRVELSLDVEVSGELGEEIALLLQQNARGSGVGIDIARKNFSLIRERMRAKDYDMAAMVFRQSPALTDLYQSWHSDSDRPDGSNYSGFGNADSDSLIEAIRSTLDPDYRRELYRQIQAIIYDEQPVIFLVAPQERIVISNQFDVRESPVRPGFFERDFRPAQ